MTVSMLSTWDCQVGEDNQTRQLFVRTQVQRAADYDASMSGAVRVAPDTTLSIGFAGITTAKFLVVEADGPCTLTLNGSAVIPIAPAAGVPARLVLDGVAITSMSITKTGGQSVKCDFLIAGT